MKMNIKALFEDIYSKKDRERNCGDSCLFFDKSGEETVPSFAQAIIIQYRVMRVLHALGWRISKKDGFPILYEAINKYAHEACKEGKVNEEDISDPKKFFSIRNLKA